MPQAHIILCAILAGLALGQPAQADEPQLYLTWNAPYGMPAASDRLTPACGDSARNDTLYMTYVPGKDSPTFHSVIAVLDIRPAPGDSLDRFWEFEVGGANGNYLHVEMNPESFPRPSPWLVPGAPGRQYKRIAGGTELSMIYAVPADQVGPIEADTLYCFARLVFRHRTVEPSGCEKPVCIEWSYGQLGFARGDVAHVRTGGSRFVSWGSADGSICDTFEAHARPPRWKPPTRGTPPESKSTP